MSSPAEVFSRFQSLRTQGQTDEALHVLGDAMRRGVLDPEGIDRAGRAIEKLWKAQPERKTARVLILGQCTTSWIRTTLTAVAWSHGSAVRVEEGEYDNVLQELMQRAGVGERPDLVILLPWSGRLLSNRDASGRIDDELAFWRQAWDVISRNWGCRTIQVGYDWVTPGPSGYHLAGAAGGDVDTIRRLNFGLREAMPPGGYFVDLEMISGTLGRESFYDPRRYFWTKQPFSEAGTVRLAEHLLAGIRALTTGPKKVVVLDLDNTLWGGVVGETGALGISLGESADGEAFRTFQAHLKGLSDRGVLLAVASKNNPEDAREPFRKHPDMVLKLDELAAFEAHWEPKAGSIERVAADLNLGLDSFVFFDDNPAERELIRQALPMVSVVEAPEDPAEYVRALQGGLWFEAAGLTHDDRERSAQYAVERRRKEEQQSFTSMDDYLRSLEMRADCRPIDESDLPRVVQLLAKTNQFNLTTRRHTRDDVLALLSAPDAIGFTLRLADRFGDHGLVSVLIAVPEPGPGPKTLRIDTWLMSCRVISRSAEQFVFGRLLDLTREKGFARIIGEYLPTSKNALVASLYDGLGFSREADSLGYTLDLESASRPVTFVTAEA